MDKRKGYYDSTDLKLDKELKMETMRFLLEKSMEFIKLCDEFNELDRLYLINHIIQLWKREMFVELTLKYNLPDFYVKILLLDIISNIRYIVIENFDIDQLQLSVKKYLAYKSKLNPEFAKIIQNQYKEYLKENYLDKMDETDDSRYNIVEAIYKKL